MDKSCSRCQKTIRCAVNDIASCDCSKVTLSNATLAFLDKTQFDCLCNECLQAIDQMVEQTAKIPFPKKGEPLVEHVHYYMQGQLFVFTEFYHLSRGYCCGNGCRHCAYQSR